MVSHQVTAGIKSSVESHSLGMMFSGSHITKATVINHLMPGIFLYALKKNNMKLSCFVLNQVISCLILELLPCLQFWELGFDEMGVGNEVRISAGIRDLIRHQEYLSVHCFLISTALLIWPCQNSCFETSNSKCPFGQSVMFYLT